MPRTLPGPRPGRCVWLDPGERTGWALWDGNEYSTGNLAPGEIWGFLEGIEDAYRPIAIGYESFRLRPGLSYFELAPVERIGVIKEWARQNDVELEQPQSSDKMSLITDDKLRRAGLWKPGKAHKDEMQALKHLLYYRRDLVL